MHLAPLPTFISQAKHSGKCYMRAEQTSRSQVWTGLPLSPEQGPPREIKKAGGFMSWQRGLINMNSLFLKKKNAGRENCEEEALTSCFGEGPESGTGVGEWERPLGDLDSLILCRRRRKVLAFHFGMPHAIVFLISFVLLIVLSCEGVKRSLCIPSAHASQLVERCEGVY